MKTAGELPNTVWMMSVSVSTVFIFVFHTVYMQNGINCKDLRLCTNWVLLFTPK